METPFSNPFPRRTSSKSRPAFTHPDIPLSPFHDVSQPSESFFNRIRSSVSGPSTQAAIDPVTRTPMFQGQQQTSFLGRKFSQAVVPAFARKASLAKAERDRNPGHLRMGETEAAEADMRDAFFNGALTIDEGSDDEEERQMRMMVEQRRKSTWAAVSHGTGKGKGKSKDWEKKLGWATPPRGGASGKKKRDKSGKRRKVKVKRGMRELDNDLDAFNAYAQNGQAALTRSANVSVTSLGESLGSHAAVVGNGPGALDLEVLPQDRPRAVLVGDGFDAIDVMADHIFRIGSQKKKWFTAPKMGLRYRDAIATGVTIRVKTGLYRTFPVDYEALEPFEEAITRLNPEVAIKIHSTIVTNIITTYIDPFPSIAELVIDANTRIQILDEVEHLARARKHQYAAFIRSEGVLCVWADHVEAVIPAAEALEESLIQFIWRGEEENIKLNEGLQVDEELAAEEKAMMEAENEAEAKAEESMDPEDIAKRRVMRQWKERPIMLIAPLSDGLAIILTMALISLGLRTLIAEFLLDGMALRFVLFIFCVPLFCIASFACMCVVGAIFQTFGPVRQVTQKSKYFSGIAPRRTMGELAHVTVQLPVYKESLEEVLMPTIESLKKAITTYERQGGSVSILICDDGLQLLPPDEVAKRKRCYFDNNIAYVARPGHGVDGFIRKGRFKKAGNMNFANALSLRVEEIMDELRPDAQAAQLEKDPKAFWADTNENAVYDQALAQAVEESQGKAWAAGNIRFGSVILIIDSDTRVPEDCFADAVSEMAESPEVAIIQHASGVMQVANHFFENGVAHFTRGIQTAISYCCASGEVAPFVGHNAFLRWSALQECLHLDPDDGVMKIWSEDHVSEDFQIAVTLQIKGYTIRWATYSGGEFEEGVSLTCDDELNRWQKYSFGCSELLFYPIRQWIPKRSIITPLFRQFFWSNIPVHSKFTIMGYIFSYYAIACSWFLTVANFFIIGMDLPVDKYYLPSWDVTLVCIMLFIGLCNVSFITLRYRLKLPDSAKTAFDQLKWVPFFCIFFTGMSMPMCAALLSHPFGYNMTWSSTVKTVEKSNFFLQLPIIWKRFWPQLVFFSLCVVMMAVMSTSLVPDGYRVNNIEVTFPLGMVTATHLLWPFALNPWFLSFSF